MLYNLKILGCGGSTGVPDIEKGFGNCDYRNLKNYRTRTSAFLSIKNIEATSEFKVISQKSSFEKTHDVIALNDFYQQLLSSKNKLLSQKNENRVVRGSCTSKGDLSYNVNDEDQEYNILFDVSPDFRQQAIHNYISKVDSILFTHFHADHIYGIDDLRSINRLMNKEIACYANEETYNIIKNSFGYVFNGVSALSQDGSFYKPALNFSIVDYYKSIALTNNVNVVTTQQNHGRINTMGFVINDKIGYATDFVNLPMQTIEMYKNLDLLIISAFTHNPHVSHMHLEEILNLLKYIKPNLAILTHMGVGMDYDSLIKMLPDNVLPAYDGMIISNR